MNRYPAYSSHPDYQCCLCLGNDTSVFWTDRNRSFRRCRNCGLVFVPEQYRLDADQEKAVYDLHQNDPTDPGYRRFLSRLSEPLLARLPPAQKGLDFGCGPGPALPAMLEAHGHQVDCYDPFYRNRPAVFTKVYDFICATEVVEHLRNPHQVFRTLFNMLKPGGWLAIMTKMVIDADAFATWHYIRDRTHICFFSHTTFAYLARRFHAGLTFAAKDVILLNTKPKGGDR